jgi:predicted lysophospholipase L1 biosynthesis ABC-type transport system permease subunit
MGPEMELAGRQIVGVVGDVRDGALNRDPQPIIYVPWAQMPDRQNATMLDIAPLSWIIRTRGDSPAVAETVQRELQLISGGVPLGRPRSMAEVVSRSTARSDFNTMLLSTFAVSALLLAAVGVYGLMAYAVARRTQEIGIRIALGAGSSVVRNMVIRQGMTVAVVGIILGLGAAYGLTQIVSSFLFGTTPRDPLVFVAAPVFLAAVTLLAVWLPARRAARLDPTVALRTD